MRRGVAVWLAVVGSVMLLAAAGPGTLAAETDDEVEYGAGNAALTAVDDGSEQQQISAAELADTLDDFLASRDFDDAELDEKTVERLSSVSSQVRHIGGYPRANAIDKLLVSLVAKLEADLRKSKGESRSQQAQCRARARASADKRSELNEKLKDGIAARETSRATVTELEGQLKDAVSELRKVKEGIATSREQMKTAVGEYEAREQKRTREICVVRRVRQKLCGSKNLAGREATCGAAWRRANEKKHRLPRACSAALKAVADVEEEAAAVDPSLAMISDLVESSTADGEAPRYKQIAPIFKLLRQLELRLLAEMASDKKSVLALRVPFRKTVRSYQAEQRRLAAYLRAKRLALAKAADSIKNLDVDLTSKRNLLITLASQEKLAEQTCKREFVAARMHRAQLLKEVALIRHLRQLVSRLIVQKKRQQKQRAAVLKKVATKINKISVERKKRATAQAQRKPKVHVVKPAGKSKQSTGQAQMKTVVIKHTDLKKAAAKKAAAEKAAKEAAAKKAAAKKAAAEKAAKEAAVKKAAAKKEAAEKAAKEAAAKKAAAKKEAAEKAAKEAAAEKDAAKKAAAEKAAKEAAAEKEAAKEAAAEKEAAKKAAAEKAAKEAAAKKAAANNAADQKNVDALAESLEVNSAEDDMGADELDSDMISSLLDE